MISEFRVCDSQTLDCLHKTYCMHMYGSELWNLNCKYVDEFRVAWRKIKRRIWRLPNRAHNAIVQNLSYNIVDQLETRIIKCIHMCLNHDNDIYRSISLSKLLCKNSNFSSNDNYLSCKYELSNKDWYLDTNHLLGKVRLKCQLNITCSSCQSVIELCEIRDGLSSCEALSNDDVCKLIELMHLYILCVLLCSIETIIVSLCANKDIIIIIKYTVINHLWVRILLPVIFLQTTDKGTFISDLIRNLNLCARKA